MSKRIKPTAFRPSAWLDTSRMDLPELPIRYGVEARISARKWLPVARDGKPLIFDTEEEALAECHRLASPEAGTPSPPPAPTTEGRRG